MKQKILDVLARHSGEPALVWGDLCWDYKTLWQRSQMLAATWRDAGVKRGSTLVALLPNSPVFILGFFAAVQLDALFVPLNPVLARREIDAAFKKISPDFLLLTPKLAASLDAPLSSRHLPLPDLASPLESQVGKPEPMVTVLYPGQPSADLVGLLSSGTTGAPKLVVRSQAQLSAECHMAQERTRIGPGDRVLCALPLFHAHGLGNAMLAALGNGATLVLEQVSDGQGEPRQVPLVFRRKQLMKLLIEQGISVFPGVPYLFSALAEGEPVEAPQLRCCISAGEKLSEAIASQFEQRFHCAIRQLYGCTEAGVVSFDDSEPPDISTVGKPLAGVQCRILDEAGKPLQSGSSGELWFSSPALCDGYRGAPKSNAERFVDGGYHSGDIARFNNDGSLVIEGRSLPFIHTGGYKVHPQEVERVLSTIPGIAEAAVIGVDDPGAMQLVRAFVVFSPGIKVLPLSEIQAHCRTHLAGYKVPRQVCVLEEMPRAASGKLRRAALHEMPLD